MFCGYLHKRFVDFYTVFFFLFLLYPLCGAYVVSIVIGVVVFLLFRVMYTILLLIQVFCVMCCSSPLCINIATHPMVSPYCCSLCVLVDDVVIIQYPSNI